MSTGVYLWGKMPRMGAKSGNLRVALEMPKGKPTRVPAFDDLNVKTLKIGLRHSAAISADGDLYTFGNGNWGVLGHGDEDSINYTKPKLVKTLKNKGVRVKDVALGEYHTMVLGEDGSVWTWGYGGKKGFFNWMYTQEVGALGHGSLDPNFTPKKVEALSDHNVQMIAAGNYHCVAVTDNQQMFNWGRGLYGVLGNGANKQSLAPVLNDEFEFSKTEAEREELPFSFKNIKACDDYTGAIMNDGALLVWGKNDRG